MAAPLLEITLSRLREFGVHDAVINVHHFADMIVDYLKANRNFGMRIEISREESLLDTGGGLKKAAYFFTENSNRPEEPLHPAQCRCPKHNRSWAHGAEFHNKSHALATLAVQDRKTSRHLLFDEHLRLCGRQYRNDQPELVSNCQHPQALAFSGIHVISPHLLAKLSENGAFSIINSYLRLAPQQEKILAFRADEYYWRDLGSPESLAQAVDDVKRHAVVR